MRKIFAIFMAICLMASAFSAVSITASAAETDNVIRVSGLKRDGSTIVEIGSYKTHAEGWEAANDFARDRAYMQNGNYDRIIVDLLADWVAVGGKFHDKGEGFSDGAIRFYDKTRITLNMNGHTINRGLTDWEYNGEVIFIADDADVIINGGKQGDAIIGPGEDAGSVQMGTITGGFSGNGAGGIHMQEATVTLNNVRLVGNKVEDDDGAAIAVHDGGALKMNGGCMSNNHLTSWMYESWVNSMGTLYVDDSTAVLNKVVISDNTSSVYEQDGVAVALSGDSTVTLNDCLVKNNGENVDSSKRMTQSIFYCKDEDSKLYINGGTIENNYVERGVFLMYCTIVMNGTTVKNNNTGSSIFRNEGTGVMKCEITNVTFIDNAISINAFTESDAFIDSGSQYIFTNCTFSNNGFEKDFTFDGCRKAEFELIDCQFEGSVFEDREYIKIIDTEAENHVGSIFGEGSLAVIISFVALIASAAAIIVNVTERKKKTVPVTATEQSEDDE